MNVYYYRLLLSSGRVRSGITQLQREPAGAPARRRMRTSAA